MELNKIEKNLEKVSHEAGQKAGMMAASLANSATDYVSRTQSYVKENPTKGVVIAAAAGLIAGSILTMALRRRH